MLRFALVFLGAAGAAILLGSAHRWRARSAATVSRLAGASSGSSPYRSADLAGLPDVVQRYFRAVLQDGQPMIRLVRLEQEGRFLLRAPDGWAPFTAVQHLAPAAPGFVWDARIRMFPGVAAWVRDGFADGNGSMHAAVLGLVPLVSQSGTPEIAAAALMRYLAEAVWCPTALLPSQGVRWAPIDDSSARASLAAGGTEVSLEFRFSADGLVESVYSPDRGRDVNGTSVPTPWQGRWFEWEERDGMRIPVRGEVEWLLPEGPQPYWRGRVRVIRFDPEPSKAAGARP